MLACALWLSFALIGIVKCGWRLFSLPLLWYKPEPKTKPTEKRGAAGRGQAANPGAEPEPVDLS